MKTQTVQIALHIFTDLWKIKIFFRREQSKFDYGSYINEVVC